MASAAEKLAPAQRRLGRIKRSVHRWPTAVSFHWLASFLERAERDPNVVSVIVIGSAARPNVASDDLDLMVLCQDVLLFGEKAPIEIDIRKANVSSVEADILAGQDVAIGAVRFGRPLLDKGRHLEQHRPSLEKPIAASGSGRCLGPRHSGLGADGENARSW